MKSISYRAEKENIKLF